MPQTSYTRNFDEGFAGQLADSGDVRQEALQNGSGVDLPAGIGVINKSGSPLQADLPASLAARLLGVVRNSLARDPGSASSVLASSNAIFAGDTMNVLTEGAIKVAPEQTVAVTDRVYMRVATSVNTPSLTQKGAFRKDADGTAAVVTITPTAADSTLYRLAVDVDGRTFNFQVTSQVSATATTIVTQFKVAMAADADFTALVTASGTATLILTANNQGDVVNVDNSGSAGTVAVALTTAPTATAVRVRNARWSRATNGTIAYLYISGATH
jgi:hypothetical protein